MGKKGSGVVVHGKSIRMTFSIAGKRYQPILKTNGRAMPATPANLKYAERLGFEIREAIRLGSFRMADYFPDEAPAESDGLTVSQRIQLFIATKRLEESSKAGYESAGRFWASVPSGNDGRAIGAIHEADLLHSQVLYAIASRPKLSGKTVNNYVSILRQAMELAVRDGKLQRNPADGVPRATWQQDPPDPFSLEEAELIIADMKANYPAMVADMVEWRFFSGVRTSEMAGLRRGSVDLEAGRCRIHEANVRGTKKTNTKTSVVRDILLTDRAMKALSRAVERLLPSEEYVWMDPRYRAPWDEERAFRRTYWTPCLERLGIRYRPPNNMRHTYATMMLMAGRKPAWCAKQMGHSVEMFLRVYTKWLEGDRDEQELGALEDWINTRKAGQLKGVA